LHAGTGINRQKDILYETWDNCLGGAGSAEDAKKPLHEIIMSVPDDDAAFKVDAAIDDNHANTWYPFCYTESEHIEATHTSNSTLLMVSSFGYKGNHIRS